MARRLILCMLTVAMLFCIGTASAEMDPKIYGEWTEYGSIYIVRDEDADEASGLLGMISGWWESIGGNSEAEELSPHIWTTRANFNKVRQFDIHEDGTMDILEDGQVVVTGEWEWDSQGVITLIEPGAAELMFAYVDSMMYTAVHYSGSDELIAYYRPSLLSVAPESVIDNGGILTNFSDQGTLTSASESKTDLRFSLNEDGEAALLLNYRPLSGRWAVDGANIVINGSDGSALTLEPQFDGSLFGSWVKKDGTASMVEFDPAAPFTLDAEAASSAELNGVWEMTGLKTSALFYVPREDLSFGFRLELNGKNAVLYMTNKSGTNQQSLTAQIVSGPILDEEKDTGTILLLSRNGVEWPFWLKKDGSLMWMNAYSESYIFEKTK